MWDDGGRQLVAARTTHEASRQDEERRAAKPEPPNRSSLCVDLDRRRGAAADDHGRPKRIRTGRRDSRAIRKRTHTARRCMYCESGCPRVRLVARPMRVTNPNAREPPPRTSVAIAPVARRLRTGANRGERLADARNSAPPFWTISCVGMFYSGDHRCAVIWAHRTCS